MKHALIVSPRDCWKHDFIHRIITALHRPVLGYETIREPSMADPILGDPIYIHPFNGIHIFSSQNLVGYCINHKPHTVTGSFDRYASYLLQPVTPDHILAFDEIGFLESQEKAFCNAILTRLDGDISVIATVKDKEIPFLNKIRHHPKCQCFYLSQDNQDVLFNDILEFIQKNSPEP